MKYIVTYSNPFIADLMHFETEDARAAADEIMEHVDDEPYDEMLDECYGEIEICGMSYSASVALYRVDECAYRCGRNDYYDSLASDIAYEIERMDAGNSEEFYGMKVDVIDDDDDDDDSDDSENK